MKRKITRILLIFALAVTVTACGSQKTSETNNAVENSNEDQNITNDIGRDVESEDITTDTGFTISDFIDESKSSLTKEMGGEAYPLTAIPDFPDADKHFHPSTEDYCLICYPGVLYLDTVDSAFDVARFDLVSFDEEGNVDTHYQAFVFDKEEDAEAYHEYKKGFGVTYRELYAGEDLCQEFMKGCAVRYGNIIYYNKEFLEQGINTAYTKNYLIEEMSFYQGIGYSYYFSKGYENADIYNNYTWVSGDEQYFYPGTRRFMIKKRYEVLDLDGHSSTENSEVIYYSMLNYDEYGNFVSSSFKLGFEDEETAALFGSGEEKIYTYGDDLFDITGELEPIAQVGNCVFYTSNKEAEAVSSYTYSDRLGDEYLEEDKSENDHATDTYFFFSCRDKDYPAEGTAATVQPTSTPNSSNEGGAESHDDTDLAGQGSWEGYFCSEEMDAVLGKPSCEVFLEKSGSKILFHVFEYQNGEVRYESKAAAMFNSLEEDQTTSLFTANLAAEGEPTGEYVITMTDHNTAVITAEYDGLLFEYTIYRTAHTVE